MGLSIKKKYNQNKIYLTFKNNEEEEKLYNFLKQKGKIGGVSNYIKIEMSKVMQREEKENNK